ncbi:MAG: hypothetical protein IJY87_01560 [Bacilli bacterium]|nr:hypothetical protein [Bacilli bacterium]
MKNKKVSKKKMLIVLVISLFTILGETLAYFTTSGSIKNVLKTALYQNKIVEEFEAPTNWTPGTTTPKTIKVTNTGKIDMAVRVSYEEKWVNGNGEELPLTDSEGNVAAIINFNDGWEKDADGFYYYGSKAYMTRVAPNETTTSFISGVTFNKNIKANLSESVSNDGQTITYTSTGDGYDAAQYTLKINIETIQYENNDIW